MTYAPRIVASVVTLVQILSGAVSAHEVDNNRVTLVQREPGHVTLDFYLDLLDVLRAQTAPYLTEQAYLQQCAAQRATEFNRTLLATQRALQAQISMTRESGQVIALTQWRWPGTAEIQQACQQQVMQASLGTDAATHYIGHIHAEAISSQSLDHLILAVPAVLQPLLTVAYAPTQTWANNAKTVAVEFEHARLMPRP